MDLKSILSDKPAPVSPPPVESSKDDKPADLSADVRSEKEMMAEEIAEREPAAPSAAQEPDKRTPEAMPGNASPTPAEKSKTSEQAKEAEAEAETVRERDEKGRFVKTVPHEAFHAERLKRQEAERKLKEQTAAKPPTSVLENEDLAFQERIAAATQPILAKFFKLSVKAAKQNRDDYEAVAEFFSTAADGDPRLWQSFQESDDPGEYVYAVGKQLKELAAVDGDIVKYGEQKRAEGLGEAAEVKKQLKALQAEIAALKESKEKQEKIPQSLNGEQSSPTKGSTYSGPKSLHEIIGS